MRYLTLRLQRGPPVVHLQLYKNNTDTSISYP